MSSVLRSVSFHSAAGRSKRGNSFRSVLPINEHVFGYGKSTLLWIFGDFPSLSECGGQFSRRISLYGRNIYPSSPLKSFVDFCLETLSDPLLILLLVAGIISIGLGLAESLSHGWYEGLSILLAVILVTLVSSYNNYQQQAQFAALDATVRKEAASNICTVIRGGSTIQIRPESVVVGELVLLSPGNFIPADGVLATVDGNSSVLVNESRMTGEAIEIEKDFYHPFLFGGTEIRQGECTMIVTAVGESSTYGQIMKSLIKEPEPTPLQKKLEKVAALIGKIGAIAASILFVALFIRWLVHVIINRPPDTTDWEELLKIVIVCVTLIVVAIPEGLPLAVTVSLAYSMKKMYKDQIIVHELAACETMGSATTICSDKTGTLTQNRMKVVECWLSGVLHTKSIPAINEISAEYKQYLIHSIVVNSKSWLDSSIGTQESLQNKGTIPEDWPWKEGNQTEIALLSFCCKYQINIAIERTKYPVEKSFPFDSTNKQSSILISDTVLIKNHIKIGNSMKNPIINNNSAPTPVISPETPHNNPINGVIPDSILNAHNAAVVNNDSLDDSEDEIENFLQLEKNLKNNQKQENKTNNTGETPKANGNKVKELQNPSSVDSPSIAPSPHINTANHHNHNNYPSPLSIKPNPSPRANANNKYYRRYFKGAAERILANCTSYIDSSGIIHSFTAENSVSKESVNQYLLQLASRGLRTIGCSFVDFHTSEIPRDEENNIREPPARENCILIALFGIEDPLRPESQSSVLDCQRAGITVRMVTGDALETAKSIATQCNIYKENNGDICMLGADLRELFLNKRENELLKIIPKLRVLARSAPTDKELLVRWLKQRGDIVAVTGDGSNDAPALNAAHVGIAMFIAGTAVAKAAAKIWILDDNFASIVKSVVWGRAVYDNIRKFVQFQLSVNVTALLLTVVGAISGYGTPLTAVQLLWVNLIMDTFAALALGTENPEPEQLLNRHPYPKTTGIVSGIMWKNILIQSFTQLTALLILLYSPGIFVNNSDIANIDETELYTMVFNTFVWLQLFNEFNCRKINGEFNILEHLFTNEIYIGIWIVTAAVQALIVEFAGSFANTTHLSWSQWLICIAIGAISIPMGILARLLPNPSGNMNIVKYIPKCLLPEEDEEEGEDSDEIPNKEANSPPPAQDKHTSERPLIRKDNPKPRNDNEEKQREVSIQVMPKPNGDVTANGTAAVNPTLNEMPAKSKSKSNLKYSKEESKNDSVLPAGGANHRENNSINIIQLTPMMSNNTNNNNNHNSSNNNSSRSNRPYNNLIPNSSRSHQNEITPTTIHVQELNIDS